MKQQDSVNEGPKNRYPKQAILVDDSFKRSLALYRRRVYEQYGSLLMLDVSDEQEGVTPHPYQQPFDS
ncbi:hypothetical protein [Spirosoma endophyticum]|uniref:Uncharacterized protein n=1 Tax=Spirosoma endophyticum TaxID=662367 RepID=A0A1I1LDA0_9BACT|nr:hypothetical protein [Spirosoma endophyticum]SFC71044.1 hypothetical protein SAMN05216167_102206 [Spirosoma endophyticum]